MTDHKNMRTDIIFINNRAEMTILWQKRIIRVMDNQPFWFIWLKYWSYTPLDYFNILPDHENLGIDIDFITIGGEMTILWRYYIFGLMAARKCGYLGLTA